MKSDERALLNKLKETRVRAYQAGAPFADEVGEALGIHPKRVAWILEKWSGKGWWESGVSFRSGWFTDKGLAA